MFSRPVEDKLIEAQEIAKRFSGVDALAGVSLSVGAGEIHSLIGENGSGKSTLIKIMAGVLAPDRGRILIDGRVFPHLSPIQAIREGIQVIYQDFSLFPNLTVAENLALNAELAAGRRFFLRRRIQSIAGRALDQLDVELDLEARVESLSVAQQQLVAISRAIVQNARLIIMDEPTAALTRKEVESLYRVIERLKARRISVLFVSHKLEEVLEVSDRISILRGGRKVAEGNAEELDASRLVHHMTGRTLVRRSETKATGNLRENPLLKVDRLSRRGCYREVSFELRSGEVVGLTGLLGSGQRDLGLTLAGMLPADSGSVSIAGRRRRLRTVRDVLEADLGYVPADRLEEGLFLNQSIERNLNANRLDQFAGAFHLLDRDRLQRESRHWAEKLEIALSSLRAPVKNLSGGNQQKVVIARWLARSPRLLILHNPTSGVDIGSKYDIHRLIRELARSGTGILIISDDLAELLETCDRLLLMKQGRLRAELDPSGVTENQLMEKIMA